MQAYVVISDQFGGEIRIPVDMAFKTLINQEPPTPIPVEPAPISVPGMKQVRTYTRDFKVRAVDLVLAGAGLTQVCKSLAVPLSTLDNWVRMRRRRTVTGVRVQFG